MEPSDWISIVAIVSGALISIVSIWFSNLERSKDRQQSRADERTERAIALYSSAQGLLNRMSPSFWSLWSFLEVDSLEEDLPLPDLPELDDALISHVNRELEWLSLMGWTPGIRNQADQIKAELSNALSMYRVLRASRRRGAEDTGRRPSRPRRAGVPISVKTLKERIDSTTTSLHGLRTEIRKAIK